MRVSSEYLAFSLIWLFSGDEPQSLINYAPSGSMGFLYVNARDENEEDDDVRPTKKKNKDISDANRLLMDILKSNTEEDDPEDEAAGAAADRILVRTLLQPPRYKGAVDEMNTMLDRLVLKEKSGQLTFKELQGLYQRLRYPYKSLEVPEFFHEMRKAADLAYYEKERLAAVRRAHRRGFAVDPALLVPISQDPSEEPVKSEKEVETLTVEEHKRRQDVINSWLKHQFLLRWCFRKRNRRDESIAALYMKPFLPKDNDYTVTDQQVIDMGYNVQFGDVPTSEQLREETRKYREKTATDVFTNKREKADDF